MVAVVVVGGSPRACRRAWRAALGEGTRSWLAPAPLPPTPHSRLLQLGRAVGGHARAVPRAAGGAAGLAAPDALLQLLHLQRGNRGNGSGRGRAGGYHRGAQTRDAERAPSAVQGSGWDIANAKCTAHHTCMCGFSRSLAPPSPSRKVSKSRSLRNTHRRSTSTSSTVMNCGGGWVGGR